jgi:glycosyltransferase involved in cell wall biosynthesis
MYRGKRVAVVIPALNEELAIVQVVTHLSKLTGNEGQAVIDQIVVCDNGSTDNTATVANQLGAKVVYQSAPGYGIACLTGIENLELCDIVLFIDGDDSCFVPQALPLLDAIVDGAQLAIGSRTLGKIDKGALTPIQKFGNWLASTLIKTIWGHPVTDLGPFRAIDYSALYKLEMQDKTFGWTVEMQVKAILHRFKIVECPVDSKIRIGESKISGTLSGTVGAGIGILSMIAKLRFKQRTYLRYCAKNDFKASGSQI